MISLLLQVVLLVVFFGVIWWLIDFIPLPQPFNKIAKVLLVVVLLIIIVEMLVPIAGLPLHPLISR